MRKILLASESYNECYRMSFKLIFKVNIKDLITYLFFNFICAIYFQYDIQFLYFAKVGMLNLNILLYNSDGSNIFHFECMLFLIKITMPKVKISHLERNTFLYEIDIATRWGKWHL
jgi:hypothetical protein